MSRPLRIQYPHAHYHICARGNERRRVFWDPKDYARFCQLLAESGTRFHLRLLAFVLMPNHFHLLLETPAANLAQAMHWLKTAYTVWLNTRRRRVGHLFQGRYHSVLVEDESHYLELSRYLHLNPVRAGLVRLPEQYAWSSCHDYLHRQRRWPWVDREPVLSEIGGRGRDRYARYRDFLSAGMRLTDEELAKFRSGAVLGSDRFRAWLAERFAPEQQGDVLGAKALSAERIPCAEAKARLIQELIAGVPDGASHRGTIMYLLQQLGYPLRDIGDLFDVSYSAVSHNARRYRVERTRAPVFERILSNVKR